MDLGEAVAALRRGELVCFPTETTYGLAADIRSRSALDRLVAASGVFNSPSHCRILATRRIESAATDSSGCAIRGIRRAAADGAPIAASSIGSENDLSNIGPAATTDC